MPGPIHKLSARRVVSEQKSGRHSDGGGLYLVVSSSGSRKWLFIYRRDGKQREMGLGAASGPNSVSLVEAREKAAGCRSVLRDGEDPLERRKRDGSSVKRSIPAFGEFADRYIDTHASGWRNAKHVSQWRTTLSTYAAPIREKPVDEITRDDVVAVIGPIWQAKNETASRIRGRIETILDAAKAEGLRSGENPAAWKGNLQHSLPKRRKLQRGHHPAMPYKSLPEFMRLLRQRDATAARALEFLILTASRTGENLGMEWNEIDLDSAIWQVPASRMKSGRTHRVPLSNRALDILLEQKGLKTDRSRHPFSGRRDAPLSGMAMTMLLRRMNVENATVHGFRSTFRDWVAEETDFPGEFAEAALAHLSGTPRSAHIAGATRWSVAGISWRRGLSSSLPHRSTT